MQGFPFFPFLVEVFSFFFFPTIFSVDEVVGCPTPPPLPFPLRGNPRTQLSFPLSFPFDVPVLLGCTGPCVCLPVKELDPALFFPSPSFQPIRYENGRTRAPSPHPLFFFFFSAAEVGRHPRVFLPFFFFSPFIFLWSVTLPPNKKAGHSFHFLFSFESETRLPFPPLFQPHHPFNLKRTSRAVFPPPLTIEVLLSEFLFFPFSFFRPTRFEFELRPPPSLFS